MTGVTEVKTLPEGAMSMVKAFLEAWKSEGWEAMLDCCQKTWTAKGDRDDRIDHLKSLFGMSRLVHYRVHEVPKEAPSSTAFKVRLTTKVGGKRAAPIECMVMRESAPYKPSEDGNWGVNPISVWHR